MTTNCLMTILGSGRRNLTWTLACFCTLLGLGKLAADPIPEGFDKSAIGFVFLIDTNGQPTQPNGTCFFVSVKTTNGFVPHLVTAKHVLQDTNGSVLSQVAVRLTRATGGVAFVQFPLTQTNTPYRVYTHPEPGVDLAVVPIAPHVFNEFRIQTIPSEFIATKESIKKLKVREGDEMFFMGLFTPFYGSSANVPVVRFGRMSMLTDERIPADKDGPQDYYLMETQVFGGNSGSAALFYFDERRNPGDTKILLAGVVKGYFLNYSPVRYVDAKPSPYATENNGIALVIPGFKLLELLFSEDLMRVRGEK